MDLTSVEKEEYIIFSMQYIAEGKTAIKPVDLVTRTFPGSHIAADIEQWIEKVGIEQFTHINGLISHFCLGQNAFVEVILLVVMSKAFEAHNCWNDLMYIML